MRTFLFLAFLFNCLNNLKSQIILSIDSNKKIDTIEFTFNTYSKLIVIVSNNQISRIIQTNNIYKLNGLQYYFTNYFLDSLESYKTGLFTGEKYLNDKSGNLAQIYQPGGVPMDSSCFHIQFVDPQKGIPQGRIYPAKFFEYNSKGKLIKISAIDANGNYNGESISLDNEFMITSVMNFYTKVNLFFPKYSPFIVIYAERDIKCNPFKVTFFKKNKRIREISFNGFNNLNLKTIKLKRNGKVKDARKNTNYTWELN